MLAVSATTALAQSALPSCYEYAKLPAANLASNTELFVVIDQTTPLDASLQQSVANNMKPFLEAGNTFSVMQFSAFTQGHYTDVLTNATLDHALEADARKDIGKNQLAKFDQCMAIQSPNAAKLAGAALRKAFSGTSSDVAKSDVLGSLKDISNKIKQSSAKQKVVLLASDMLENSSISSFYAKQAVRQIDPQKELKLVADNQLFADFGGAKVYVIGAGLLTADASKPKGVYRDPKTMAALQQFWRTYFEKSNAKLVEFGQPALLNPLR
ncbi:hypothetical protein HQ393_14580 [Chitinibacter bivalviorum]|uniref:VWFA domain-containing protein n=2 Tax=Chitinibacter bivalviorum TaxID=2739434 RepID=A0A7H9BNZ5_9NEIS|nr:hypothetical protein HQ393_14580 [Chitinibacter bivalviorum]